MREEREVRERGTAGMEERAGEGERGRKVRERWREVYIGERERGKKGER